MLLPPYDAAIVSSTPCRLVVLLLAFLLAVSSVFIGVSILSTPTPACAAGTLLKDLPAGAPKQGVVVSKMDDFFTNKPVFSTDNPAFVQYEGRPWTSNAFVSDGTQGISVKYNGTVSTSGVPGSFSWRWNNIAYDTAGKKVDIVLRVSNVHSLEGIANTPALLVLYRHGYVFANATTPTTDGVKVGFDIQYFFYYSGTDTPITDKMVLQFVDLDMNYAPFAESITLLEEYDPEIHIIPDDVVLPNSGDPKRPGCWRDISNIDDGNDATHPTFRASLPPAGTNTSVPDNNTLHTGFCVSAKNGFKMSWTGWGCATVINEFYGQHTSTASRTDGGTISDEGKVSVPWTHDKTYTIQADRLYKISSVKVDGTPIEITDTHYMKYTFSSVVADHTIEVAFEYAPEPVCCIWVDSLTGDEVARYDLFWGDTSPIPSIPSHRGHRFTGLSGDTWYSITEDRTVYINYSPYLYTIPSGGSASYNGFTFSYKA